MTTRSCEYCGRPFAPQTRTQRFCSRSCSNRGQPRGVGVPRGRLPGSQYERNAAKIKAMRYVQYHSDAAYRQRALARAQARRTHPEPQPCERCGSTTHVDRHHHDYCKPDDITWLCRTCHVLEHGTWGLGLARRA